MVPPHPAPNTPGHTLNAIARPEPEETDAEATTRHLRMCRRLAELGMNLAEAAAREADRNLEAPLEYPMPGAALPPLSRTADPGLLFARLSRAVRQAIALEARIRADRLDQRNRASTPNPRAPTSSAPYAPSRETPSFRAEPDECLHDEFADDHGRPAPQVIADIRKDLGLPPEKELRRHKDVVAYPPPPRIAPLSRRPPTPHRPLPPDG